MRKYFIGYIIGVVILCVIIYVAYAFVLLEANALKWTEEQRFAYVCISFAVIILGIPITAMVKVETED